METVTVCRIATLLLLLSVGQLFAGSATLPAADERLAAPKDLNTRRTFPVIRSRADWQSRADEIRTHVLVSCGLWPLPEKTPLNSRIFGRIERDGYTVEKVYLQTYPGFYLAGNLYRPRAQGNGPFPGVLNPHGHWRNGRMADEKDGSIAARCIHFARNGMIAFSYDMVGYNDTKQVSHKFAADPTNQLWQISLMGLQTWNSIRALDFLESLPDVDRHRLACTGESGGGTQTFMLGAVDRRLRVQAPIVMVSHSMQGGCQCENAPGLRVDYSNMEIAAVPAPRPQILVAATGDWTKMTMTVEGPALQGVYNLFKAPRQLTYRLFDFDHNYNQTSREAVYSFFKDWLLPRGNQAAVKEAAYNKEPDADLLVWPDGKLPADALDEPALVRQFVARAQEQLARLEPRDRKSLERYRETLMPAWRHSLEVEFPTTPPVIQAGAAACVEGLERSALWFGRPNRGDRIPAVLVGPSRLKGTTAVVFVHPQGKSASLDPGGWPIGLARELVDAGCSVLLPDLFLTGDSARPDLQSARKPFTNYFTTYNRTDAQERVQDIITACAAVRSQTKARQVIVVGAGAAGRYALLAAPAADGVVADMDGLDTGDFKALMLPELFVPGLLKLGSFEGVAALSAPHPLLVHNAGTKFDAARLQRVYSAAGSRDRLRIEERRLEALEIRRWVANLR